MYYLNLIFIHSIFLFFKSFWNDFPSGKMDKKGFIKYYEEIKDEKDKTNVLCEYK